MKTLLVVLALFAVACFAQQNNVPFGKCFNATLDQLLVDSDAMPAQVVSQELGIPFEIFWDFFSQGE